MGNKRGPKPLGNTTELRVSISPYVDRAIEQLAVLRGVSKATAVRYALLATLCELDLVYPERRDELKATLTSGPRGLTANQKEN